MVLDLLYELHGSFARSVLPQEVFPFHQDRDFTSTYREYLDEVVADHGAGHIIYVLEDARGGLGGFILGSIEHDRWNILTPAGVVEDWYVRPAHQGQGHGKRLYRELERFFRGRGRKLVKSSAWWSNLVSRGVHGRLGFVEYRVELRKLL